MKLLKKIASIFILIIMFVIINYSWRYFYEIEAYSNLNRWIKYAIRYSFQIFACLIFAFLLLKTLNKDGVFEYLGLNKLILRGLKYSFIFTLPMLIGFLLISPLNTDIKFLDILFWSFISAFAEELIFRGFLFGLLFRVFKIGFIPIIIVVSLIFAFAHIYQGDDLASIMGVVAITFVGSVIFGWLYIEWDYNLWVPVGTHILMNLYWMIFDIEATNAIGGWGPNIFRFITILLIISLTLLKIRRSGSNLKQKWLSFDYSKSEI